MHRRAFRARFGQAVAVLGLAIVAGRAQAGSLIALASFNGSNGSNPSGGVTIDGAGNLYGTAQAGGPYGPARDNVGYGTVWEIAKGTTNITAVASFNISNPLVLTPA
jgi:hypothetical protein